LVRAQPSTRCSTRTNVQGGRHLPQSNDAELTELYTASTGVDVEDNEPNTGPPAGPPANNFDVRLQAVAGNAIGNSGADYTLRLDCIDESLSLRNASMSRGPLNQQFNAGNGWVATGGNFVKEQTANITVDNAARGHVLRYVATLVSANGDVVSFIESNKFILI
jgi:hypothetical protein